MSVSGYDLRATPEEITFDGKSGDIICETIQISLDSIKEITIEDRWAPAGSSQRIFLLHNLTSKKLNIDVNYKKEHAIVNNKKIEICISGPKGNYHGLFLIRVKKESAGIGVWANVNITENSFANQFTGKVIKQSSNGSMFVLIGLMLITFGLLTRKLFRKINATQA